MHIKYRGRMAASVLSVVAAAGVLLASVCAATAQIQPGQTFPLVDGGKQAVIVTGGLFKQARLAWRYVGDYPPVGAPTAVDAQAARLQTNIASSTGRTLTIVPESEYKPVDGQPVIYLGATKKAQELFGDRLKEVDTDAYVIHVTPDFVVLAGNVDFAVYDFLSTYLGIDQYIVTELFTVLPKHDRVSVPVETRFEVPAFFSRALNCFRDGKTYRLHGGVGRYAFHHNIGEKFLLGAQFPDHPEYFAWVDGKRIPCTGSRTPNPCVLNSNVIDIVTKYCQGIFDKQPQVLSASLAMNDSFRYCQCEFCKPLQGKGRSLVVGGNTTGVSDYWYTFQNAVAKRIQVSHPGRFIGTLAYAFTDNPPTFTVERNILPYIADSSADWGHIEERNRDLERSQVWIDRVDRVGLYEYMYGGAYMVPRLFTRNLAARLRPVAAKRPGSGFYAEIGEGGRGFDGPKLWMAERLLWNPNQDIDALMTRWCKGCFGPAAAPMKAYFDGLEAALDKGAARVKPTGILYGYRNEEQFALYLPEDFPPLWKSLDEARAAVGGDPLLLQRIDYFASCLKISDILVQRYHAGDEAMALIKKKAAPGEVLASLLKNEPQWPRVEIWRDISQLQAKDLLRVGSGPEGGRVALIMEYVLEGSAWPAIVERAAKGNADAAGLRQAAREALDRLVVAGQDADPAAATRLQELREAATRVAAAKRTAKPPVIDGNPDEACWTWNGQKPWFMRNTGMPLGGATDFALAYDDRNLYIALRCGDQDVGEYASIEQKQGEALKAYGFDTKRTPSVHVFIDLPPAAAGSAPKMPPYQVVPNVFGGLWEKYKAVASHKTSWNPEKGEWQVEMAIGWENLQVKPAESRLLRLNVVRHMHNQWNRNVGGWYLSREVVRSREAQANERGWLVLE